MIEDSKNVSILPGGQIRNHSSVSRGRGKTTYVYEGLNEIKFKKIAHEIVVRKWTVEPKGAN